MESTSHDLKFLDLIVEKKRPDHVRIRYYPSSDEHRIERDVECAAHLPLVATVKELCEDDMVKLRTYLKSFPCASGTFTEYGIKDTFIRVSNTDTGNKSSRMFFRRELHMFKIEKFSGMFVLEMFKMCEEEDLPHIVNYQHDANYSATTYTIEKDSGDLRICFTKIKHQNITDKSKDDNSFTDKAFVDINMDLEISSDAKTLQVSKSVNGFLDDIVSLRNKLKLAF